jgi:Ca2+-binding RTX toxin-like protein
MAMADYTVFNAGNVDGGPEVDRLIYIYNTATNDVWLHNLTGTLATGYSGMFDGMGSNNCTFTGIENFTFIDQSGGNDDIHTGDGDDELNGGAGNDILYGNGGIDTIIGGAGNDFWGGDLSTAAVAITINLNGDSTFLGTGSVSGVEGMDVRTGSGNDTLVNHRTVAMNNTIDTGLGNDRITIYMLGSNTVAGGGGSDLLTVFYETATNDVYLTNLTADPGGGYSGMFDGLGSNNLSFSGIERFSFTDRAGGNDIINTGNGNDVLNGGAGNDILNGGAGIDRINGGTGLDRAGLDLSSAVAGITINLNVSSTFLVTGLLAGVEAIDIVTGSGKDNITGHKTSAMNDSIVTGDGDDKITLYAGGFDVVNGGAGNDTLFVTYSGAPNDVAVENFAADTVNGGYSGKFNGTGATDIQFSGIDRFVVTDLSGGPSYITTGNGNDVLRGGGGNDVLMSGSGIDRIIGGAGTDMWGADLSAAATAIIIDLNVDSRFLGTGLVRTVEGLTLTTGSGADVITGHQTGALNDTVSTGNGNDQINLFGGGSDVVNGGAGTDTLSLTYAIATNGVYLNNLAVDAVNGGYTGMFDGLGSNNVSFTGIERFIFTDVTGGNDIIRTGDFADIIDGGSGVDEIWGGGGGDSINGGNGADAIWGGRGNDTLRGGGQADTFIYDKAVNEDRDTITDFLDGTDHIRISGSSFAELAVSAYNVTDTLVQLASGTRIILQNVAPAQIAADDFIFT